MTDLDKNKEEELVGEIVGLREMEEEAEEKNGNILPHERVILESELPELAAIIANAVNKAWCEINNDFSTSSWNETPEIIKQSVRSGVLSIFEKPETTPEESHQNWLDYKIAEGWVYGEVKDIENKIHPCLKPYSELPEHQKVKDKLFHTVVHTVMNIFKQRTI